MLSYTCKAAVKAVLYLATRANTGNKSGIKEIAEAIQASEHTSAKMLQLLAKRAIINSVKGPTGGFYISNEQLCQPVISIVTAIDGPAIFQECGLGLNICSETHPCPIHDQYKVAREIIRDLFQQTTIQVLAQKLESGDAFISDKILS
jgi:Rrf2 family protein